MRPSSHSIKRTPGVLPNGAGTLIAVSDKIVNGVKSLKFKTTLEAPVNPDPLIV